MDYHKIEKVIEDAFDDAWWMENDFYRAEFAMKAGFKEVDRQIEEEKLSVTIENNHL